MTLLRAFPFQSGHFMTAFGDVGGNFGLKGRDLPAALSAQPDNLLLKPLPFVELAAEKAVSFTLIAPRGLPCLIFVLQLDLASLACEAAPQTTQPFRQAYHAYDSFLP